MTGTHVLCIYISSTVIMLDMETVYLPALWVILPNLCFNIYLLLKAMVRESLVVSSEGQRPWPLRLFGSINSLLRITYYLH